MLQAGISMEIVTFIHMKTLYLHRHAKSSWDHPGLSDFDRPLNDRGYHDAPEMGLRLVQRGVQVDAILSSTAVRALSTAKFVASELGFPENHIQLVEQLYLPSVAIILETLNAIDDRFNKVILFGHNPGFTEAVHYLAGDGPANLPTAGVARIDFPFEEWKLVSGGTGELCWLDYPKKVFES
jgi:phosphohistidine phosphatase